MLEHSRHEISMVRGRERTVEKEAEEKVAQLIKGLGSLAKHLDLILKGTGSHRQVLSKWIPTPVPICDDHELLCARTGWEDNSSGVRGTTVFLGSGGKSPEWTIGQSQRRKDDHVGFWKSIACKFSTASTVHYESYLLNAIAPGKSKSPETDTNNNAKSFMLLLFNYNEPTHFGNNNNDVFE